jgi:hypothetical protein
MICSVHPAPSGFFIQPDDGSLRHSDMHVCVLSGSRIRKWSVHAHPGARLHCSRLSPRQVDGALSWARAVLARDMQTRARMKARIRPIYSAEAPEI